MLDTCGSLIGCLFRLVAALLAILFVITVILVLLLLNADQMLFTPALYQNALSESHIYEQLPRLAAEQIYSQMHNMGSGGWAEGNPLQGADQQAQGCARADLGDTAYEEILSGYRKPTQKEIERMQGCGIGSSSSGEGGAPAFFTALTSDQWSSILTQLLPAQWLRTTTESVLRQAFDMISDPAAPVRVNILLQEFKTRLTGQAGVDVVKQILAALPPCPAGQIPTSDNPSQLLECRPSDEVMAQVEPQIREALQQAATGIPDEVDLLQPVREAGMLSANATNLPAPPRQLLLYGRWIVRLSPILCLGLLVLITLLAVRSWKGWLRWWGFPILSAGLGTVVTAAVAWGGLAMLISLARQDLPANFAPDLLETLGVILTAVVRQFALALGGQGAVIGFVGFIMLIISLFLRGSHPPALPPPAAAQVTPSAPGDDTASRGIFG